MSSIQEMEKFYESFETLPKLISDLALSVAAAQSRMDVTYIHDMKALLQIIASLYRDKDGNATVPPADLISLFKTMGPTRYQFTETVVEIRADMQLTTGSQFSVGISAPFAVAVNASYTRRTASDYRASALIRTVLHAVSADPGVMQTLLNAAATLKTELPEKQSQKALQEAFAGLAQTFKGDRPAAGELPTETPAPDKPAPKNPE